MTVLQCCGYCGASLHCGPEQFGKGEVRCMLA